MRCLLGLDDTDSRFGHCTTHLGYRLVGALLGAGCTFDAYPRLVRLNPNIPFKTRGNAAVCVEFESRDPDLVFEIAQRLLTEEADVENGANSGLVLVEAPVPAYFRELYLAAVSGVVSHKKVMKSLAAQGVRHSTLGNGMGLVGAAASVGFAKEDDHTYEIIAYRTPGMAGRPRRTEERSVLEMERRTFPHTFNSYDHGSGRVLITPHGPDPVFMGIRADSPQVALRALEMVRCEEDLLGHVIYLSNQCTDAHLWNRLTPELKTYHAGWLEGRVEGVEPGEGGHLYIDIEAQPARQMVRCAVYEPSRDLRRMAGALVAGDQVRVSGGVRRPTRRHRSVVNVEKIEALSLPPQTRFENPSCRRCGTRMKSEGRGKGFQCRRCGTREPDESRVAIRPRRSMALGVYLPSPGAQRHLTKQLIRYGAEITAAHPLIEGWWAENAHAGPRSGNLALQRRDLSSTLHR